MSIENNKISNVAKKQPLVTINVLTWNGSEYLPWLLKSLKEQTFKNWKLLVLDNASVDNSLAIVHEHCPEAKVIRQKNNVGFARGNNLLINWSDTDYIFAMNQDVILDKDFLKKNIDFLEKNEEVASSGGKILYWDFHKGTKTKTIDSFGLKIDRKRQVVDRYQGQKDFDIKDMEVFGLSAAAVVYRKKALQEIAVAHGDHFEYFDEAFFAYKEDVDLAWRLRILGWQHWILGDTRAYHHRTLSTHKNLRDKRKYHAFANKLSYRNHLMMIYKNSFYKNLVRDFWQIKWYEFKKFLYLALFERNTLKGFGEYFKSLPELSKKRSYLMKNKKINADDMYKWFE